MLTGSLRGNKERITFIFDKFVKTKMVRWLSKKLHMRGAHFFYHFGVLRYVVMIEKNAATK
jgi:hypothetical protein